MANWLSNNLTWIIVVIFIIFIALSIWLGRGFNGDWYKSLNTAPGQPPSKIFGIVWAVLYTIIFISAIILVNSPGAYNDSATKIMWILIAIIFFTFLWVFVFLNMKNATLATVVILITLVLSLVLLQKIWYGTGGWLLFVKISFVLFALWLVCATYFNAGVVVLNQEQETKA